MSKITIRYVREANVGRSPAMQTLTEETHQSLEEAHEREDEAYANIKARIRR